MPAGASVTGPVTAAALDVAALAANSYDTSQIQDVSYTYWPVNYYLGDAYVISNAPLPLSGVSFSQIMKGVGEFRATIQLADPDVRSMNPWELIYPRKTGIVAVRTIHYDDETQQHEVAWHGQVWSFKPTPDSGRREIVARTIEFAWSRRLITGPMAGVSAGGQPGGDMVWAQKDRTVIVQDLLTPPKFSQIGPAGANATVAASAAGSATTFVATTANAALVNLGDYAYITASDGTRREDATGNPVFRVQSKSAPVGGNVTITFTPASATAVLATDTLTTIDLFPGWITVDKPTKMTGQLHDHSYKRNQQTNLLQAHQDRSNVGDGYDWFTSTRVLDGTNALDAVSFRQQFVMGYPRLGRQYGVDNIPRFTFRTNGQGNVISADPVFDGSGVSNAVWGQGAGFDDSALRAVATNSSDWDNGFLMTEDRYSNPDVSVGSTLQAYTSAALVQSYANEQFLQAVEVRGDLMPYFGTYALGDDALYTSDDYTNPDGPFGDRDFTMLTRIMGWTVTPPEGTNAEKVKLVLGAGEVGDFG